MNGKGKRMKIYISEQDKWEGESLYKALLNKFRELEIAGATVIAGIAGYGLGSRVKQFNVWDMKEELPIIIEIVDMEAKIEKLMPVVDKMVIDGLITLEDIQILKYSSKHKNGK
jgi:PII-like signaling protein